MPISLDQIYRRSDILEKIEGRDGLKEAEKTVLYATELAWSAFDKEIDIVDRGRCMGRDIADPKYKIKASVGITFLNSEGQVLLKRVDGNVFTLFRREIEEGDFKRLDVPVTIFAVHRALKEAKLQSLATIFNRAILSGSILTLRNRDEKLVRGDFHAHPVFLIRFSKCTGEEIQKINQVAKEAMDLVWVSLPEILKQRAKLDAAYQEAVDEYQKTNQNLSQREFDSRCRQHSKLSELRKCPVEVSASINGKPVIVEVRDEERTLASI